MSSRRNEGADIVDVRKIEGGEGKRIGKKGERVRACECVCVCERERDRQRERERGEGGQWKMVLEDDCSV